MARRHSRRYGVRGALPPLHDKEVELISIKPYVLGSGVYKVDLWVNRLRYRVDKGGCKDELDVLTWLAKLCTPPVVRTKKPTQEEQD